MALPERADPRELLKSLGMIDREKLRAASGLDPKTYQRFCQRLDVARQQLLEGLKQTQIPDFPNAWNLNELNDPIFAGQYQTIQNQAPGVDPAIVSELKEYFAAFQEDRDFDIDLPKHDQFVQTREWDKFGVRQLEEARSRHDADDFEFADWAYSGVLSKTGGVVKDSASDHSTPKAWKQLVAIANQPAPPPVDAVQAMDDFLSSAIQQADAQASQPKPPPAVAPNWASWVQSVATTGSHAAESIDVSMQLAQDIAKHLSRDVAPQIAKDIAEQLSRDAAAAPPGKFIESWSQWLKASLDQSRPPAADKDKDKDKDKGSGPAAS